MRGTVDVVVIGAGVSGLVCADRLVAGGATVTVVEARDRVGGRTLSVPLGQGVADLGGQWISPGQQLTTRLAAELGIATFVQHRTGRAVVVEPERGPRSLLARLPFYAQLELAYRARQLERLRRQVPVEDPAAAPRAAAWDAMSLADWIGAHVRTPQAAAALALVSELQFAVAPDELSFLWFLHALNASGGLVNLPAAGASGPELRLAGGAQGLCSRLAERLGDRVLLARPVTALRDGGDAVVVTAAGEELAGRRAVLAVPPSLCERITVEPALPAARRLAQQQIALGGVIKVVAAYDRPFWRAADLSGEAYNPGGTVRAVVDSCAPGGEQAALTAFLVGPTARDASAVTAATRRAAVLADLVVLFGADAGTPSHYLEHDWIADPWSGGCVPYAGPGALAPGTSGHAALRTAIGRLHFAGTEAALHWPGYLEGAIESAHRAAGEILALLERRTV